MSSEMGFWSDLLELYRKNSAIINRKLHVKNFYKNRGEDMLFNFCADSTGSLNYEHLCHLALVISNVLGRRMPDNIHNRMILGRPNQWVKKYVEYSNNLLPPFWGMNRNENHFKFNTLGRSGNLIRMALK